MNMYKYIFLALLPVLFACQENKVPEETKMLFNDGWKFYRIDPHTDPPLDCHLPDFNDSAWEEVRIPHTPRIEPLVVNDQWQGDCWYRKTFSLPESYKDRILFLKFEAAMNVATIWLNGEPLGEHLGGYLPFSIDLTGKLLWGEPNVIAVKLNNEDNPVTGPKPLITLDFNTYGGIYRDVTLISKDPVYITDANYEQVIGGGGIFFRTENVSAKSAQLIASTHVRSRSDKNQTVQVVYSLYDQAHQKVITFKTSESEVSMGGEVTLAAEELLTQPDLWSPASPNLYKLEVELLTNGVVTDREELKVGIRDIKITNEGLWLNGEKTFLRGVNRHQEYPYIGYALSDNAQYRDVYTIKEAGFDYIRSAHYPFSPAFLDACDELGILLLDPILGWQYFGDEAFAEFALESCRQLIRRDRNHPCILAWELSINESWMPESFMDQTRVISKEEFPVTNCYNAGWINYEAYDIYIEARQHRNGLNPTRPLIVSEYGDWEYYAQNAGFNQDSWADLKSEDRSSRQPRGSGEKRLLQQARNIQEAHNDNLSTHAFADGYWVMFDYNRGYSDDLEFSGILDIFRLPKYSAWFFRSQLDPAVENVLFIASEWKPGVSQGVRAFSNADEVGLYLDGVLVERRKPDTDLLSDNLKHPPFSFPVNCEESGVLEAVGYINGTEVSRTQLATAGTPETVTLLCPFQGKVPATGCNDVLFVYAEIKDATGTVVPENGLAVTFSVEGDAEIIGPQTVEAQAGIAAILIRIGDKRAPVKIKTTSACKDDELTIEPV
ncbi:MAG: DUF4982 domain-containing protein [Tannerellaceae bacterium]|nr:DUF4982 domain-containing protein [Tannerellaceae bacterium]